MTGPTVLFIGPTTAIFPRSHFLTIVLPDKFGWAAVTKVQPHSRVSLPQRPGLLNFLALLN